MHPNSQRAPFASTTTASHAPSHVPSPFKFISVIVPAFRVACFASTIQFCARCVAPLFGFSFQSALARLSHAPQLSATPRPSYSRSAPSFSPVPLDFLSHAQFPTWPRVENNKVARCRLVSQTSLAPCSLRDIRTFAVPTHSRHFFSAFPASSCATPASTRLTGRHLDICYALDAASGYDHFRLSLSLLSFPQSISSPSPIAHLLAFGRFAVIPSQVSSTSNPGVWELPTVTVTHPPHSTYLASTSSSEV